MATVERPSDAARGAARNPALELLERLGYVVRGALYAATGVLALRLALSQPGGGATDLSGGLLWLISNPFGTVVLVIAIIGLGAYSVWGIVRAIFDPLHRGDNASGYVERLGFVSSAVSYGAIVIFGLKILIGSGGGSTDSTKHAITSVLNHPAGGLVTIVIGLVAIGVGIGQFIEAYRAVFKWDLKGAQMSDAERDVVIALGRFGMFARGVIFLIVGWFILQAGLHHDPNQVQGFGGAFLFMLDKPYGHVIVGVVALGFISLGLHSLACARWIRLMGSSA
jgi:Domain of Unknown Function (DUF1206)